jgi:hypothetical protein
MPHSPEDQGTKKAVGKRLRGMYYVIIAHLAAYELPCAGTEATREPSHTCKARQRTRQTFAPTHKADPMPL